MRLVATASRIAFAHGRVEEYVKNDIGATSPGRWQPWQCFCSTGRTSLWKVTGAASDAALAQKAAPPRIDSKRIMKTPKGVFHDATKAHRISAHYVHWL